MFLLLIESRLKYLIFLIIIFLFSNNAYALPSFQEVKNSYKKSEVYLLDRHGEIIHEMRIDNTVRRLDWTELKDISPSLIKAVIHSEDRNFYEHSGVDWKALVFSFIKNIFSDKTRGASTITMQVVSILDKRLKPKKTKRTISQKIEQIKSAIELEKTWTKQQILEAYLNLVYFRGEIQGISAAAHGIFQKSPSGLTNLESIILASLIPAPNSSITNLAKRACLLSESLKYNISCEEIKNITNVVLSRPYFIKPSIALAPQVARKLLTEGKNVTTTIDRRIQSFAIEVLNRHLSMLKAQNVNDGAVLVVDNDTGEILAYVANSGALSTARHVDGIIAKRQAGSTLKPFLYELALEKRIITSASLIEDSPLNIPTERGIYVPKNYAFEYRGVVSVRTALASSINIPAVRVLMLVGVENFAIRLKQLGFEDIKDGEYYGESMALGTVDVSLYELVNAYRTLANRGRWSKLVIVPEKRTKRYRRVMEEESAFIVSDIISDREARSETFGFENPISTRFWTAVKTGTSKDMRDNWCIGFSRKYTVGVWVGNFYGGPMWNVSGVSGAAPVWLEIMNYLHRNIPSNVPKPPHGVVAKKVNFKDRIEPDRLEWFIKGTEIDSFVVLEASLEKPQIVYPVDGTTIAIDPDIPEDNQIIMFQFKPQSNQYEWILNNERTGIKDSIFLWKPEKGVHRLAIINNENTIVDSVVFIVK